MARGKSALVLGQLEDIDQKVLVNYRDAVRDMIRGKHGVYALYKKDRLYYVGLASNLMGRLRQHLSDKHKKQWNRFSVYLVDDKAHIKELETLFLRISKPIGNSVKGRFVKSQNLRQTLNKNLKAHDEKKRAQIFGGHIASRHRRKIGKHGKGKNVLARLIDRKTRIRAWDNGYEYTAYILRDGTINYSGWIFDSPSACAKYALKRGKNGWQFWHYRAGGKWLPIANLKK